MSASLLAVIVDCRDPRHQAEVWARALAYKVSQRNPDEFLVSDPVGAGGALYFMKVPEPKVGKNRLHLDLVTSGSMQAEVTRLVEVGAELVEVRQDPVERRCAAEAASGSGSPGWISSVPDDDDCGARDDCGD